MRWSTTFAGLLASLGTVLAQDAPDSSAVVDAATGFKFGSFSNDKGVVYRVAIPSPINGSTGFDIVFQTIVPISVGWSGFAWGGSMTYNPLTIVWLNGTNVVVSSREAYGYFVPAAYPNATYTILPKGTHVNATHYQVTAQCSGCTYWGDSDVGYTYLDPSQTNAFAFAYAATPPQTPASNTSSFSIHDQVGHWIHDLSQGNNTNFKATVAQNL